VAPKPRSSLSQQVYERLVDQIIRGHVRYGDVLNIKAIAMQFGVSTMPIRDAIKRLEAERIVEVRPRSNCYVRMPTTQSVLQAMDSRQMLEMFSIQRIYPKVTLGDLEGLRCILDTMGALVAQPRGAETVVPEYIELDHRFHAEICHLAGNEYVDRFYRETNLHLSMSFRYGPGMCHGMRATYEEHQAIYHHLAANSELAVSALRDHLEESRRNILRERGLCVTPEEPLG
jgi:DNA-binding GntR family transcriptional regulator